MLKPFHWSNKDAYQIWRFNIKLVQLCIFYHDKCLPPWSYRLWDFHICVSEHIHHLPWVDVLFHSLNFIASHYCTGLQYIFGTHELSFMQFILRQTAKLWLFCLVSITFNWLVVFATSTISSVNQWRVNSSLLMLMPPFQSMSQMIIWDMLWKASRRVCFLVWHPDWLGLLWVVTPKLYQWYSLSSPPSAVCLNSLIAPFCMWCYIQVKHGLPQKRKIVIGYHTEGYRKIHRENIVAWEHLKWVNSGLEWMIWLQNIKSICSAELDH